MLEASRFRALRAVVAGTFRDGGFRAFYVGLTPGRPPSPFLPNLPGRADTASGTTRADRSNGGLGFLHVDLQMGATESRPAPGAGA
jgi:hypothetical protein